MYQVTSIRSLVSGNKYQSTCKSKREQVIAILKLFGKKINESTNLALSRGDRAPDNVMSALYQYIIYPCITFLPFFYIDSKIAKQ